MCGLTGLLVQEMVMKGSSGRGATVHTPAQQSHTQALVKVLAAILVL